MVSVQRQLDLDKIPQEATDGKKMEPEWPQEGRVSF